MLEKCCNWILWSKSWREIDRKSIEAGNCFNFLPLTPPRPPQRGAAAAAFSLSRVPLKLDQIRTLFLLKFLFFSFQFKRMLNKELSHFSESKSGNQISEYICSTFLGKYWNLKFIIRKEESSWERSTMFLQKWIFCIRTVIVICTKTHVSLQLRNKSMKYRLMVFPERPANLQATECNDLQQQRPNDPWTLVHRDFQCSKYCSFDTVCLSWSPML